MGGVRVDGSDADGRAGVLVAAVRAGLARLADPAAAPAMQRYMKSAMPFRGVAAPARASLLREVAGGARDGPVLETAARALWDGAQYREERYLATGLSGLRPFPTGLGVLPLYEHWIVTGAWWDHVDEIASHRIGPLLRAHPAETARVLRAWAVHPDRWLRRTAVIAQLGSRERTDTALLTEVIEANLGDGDFFLRKGIGWALRQYARTDPAWVRAFVAAHPGLSGLSRREALKHLAG